MKYCIAIGRELNPKAPLPLTGDFVESIRTARQLGYQAVEIHTPDPGSLDAAAIRAVCRECQMEVATLGTGIIYGKYGLHLMDEDAAKRSQLVELVKEFILLAKALGSRVTIGSIKGNVPEGEAPEKYLTIMGETLKALDAFAGEHGVILLLEATNRYENNVINTAAQIRGMVEANQLQNVLGLVDAFHMNIEETDTAAALAALGKYLGHIHFADNTRMYPGAGAFPFEGFCQSICAVGYDGVVSVECLPLPDGMTAARETIAFFRKHFDAEQE